MTTPGASVRMSHGLDVLPPKADQAFPIPCAEWDHLKGRVSRLTNEPWLFHTAGSILVGAAITTFVAILVGGIANDAKDRNYVIAWAVVTVAGLLGAACWWFASKERTVHRERATDIVDHMTLIEARFEGRAV